MRRGIVATLAFVSLTACGSAHIASVANGGTARVIPWIDTPPGMPTPTPPVVVPAGTPACGLNDLRVTYQGGQGLGGGQLIANIAFVNASSRACVLQGVPTVVLLDNHGSAIKTVPSGYRASDRADPVVLAPQASSRQAYVSLVWPAIDMQAGGVECPSPTAAALRISLTGGGASMTLAAVPPADMPMQIAIAPCHGLFAVGAYQADEPSVAPMLAPHPFSYRLDLPSSVRAGNNLQYTVAFTNIQAAPFTFSDACPYYHEDLYFGLGATLGRPLGKHLYSLNCHPVKAIAPNASVTFAMVLDVPSMATPGDYTLLWAPEEGIDIQDIQRLPIKVTS